ncbi:MAG: hypothetical protein KA248_09280 [Kiritimatiellae bacterium]|nr:hypothetical protein [Kiritimatiellia bacterium]
MSPRLAATRMASAAVLKRALAQKASSDAVHFAEERRLKRTSFGPKSEPINFLDMKEHAVNPTAAALVTCKNLLRDTGFMFGFYYMRGGEASLFFTVSLILLYLKRFKRLC